MSSEDLNSLCNYLNLLSAEELHRIDDFRFSRFPRLSGSTRERAIRDIRSFLESVDPLDLRLEYVGWFYSWLASQCVFQPWTVYRLDASSAARPANLPERLEHAMRSPTSHTKMVAMMDRFGRYACIMTRNPAMDTLRHEVTCVCVWNMIPYLAVCPVAMTDVRRLGRALSTVLRGEHAQRAIGNYQTCWDALTAATNNFVEEHFGLR
ncbi:hypothetical protein HPB50_024193 [Hyalomma asiaticum]|uniref:Uncharacterized protein n=1 Tax=Hyalomma asiaticum TaxID=266040 RepID=A0ACB7RP66_HYAAI|nr:hypothetical protein HPB50_024193 [Hyalomma asiaticum]